jgi:hypothetical protein
MNGQPKVVAHRANLYGSDSSRENRVFAIQECLVKGFDVEIDVRLHELSLFLGHDTQQEAIDINFLKYYSSSLWVHCKCVNSLVYLLEFPEVNCFFHDDDDVTLTSHNFIWTYPRKQFTTRSVIVATTLEDSRIHLNSGVYGICTDFGGII